MKDNNNLAQRRARLSPEQRQRLAQRLQTGKGRVQQDSIIPLRAAGEPVPLSYAQQRHWFLWQLDPHSTAYHLGGTLRLRGKLNQAALEDSFQTLIARHEALRTVFRANAQGQPEQIIQAEGDFKLTVIDLNDLPAEQRTARAHVEAIRIYTTPFDLTQGPLLRVALVRLEPEEHYLVVVMHHIISDAWSNRIIIDEFAACYRAHRERQSAVLPSLSIQYADYALWQRNFLETGEKERQLTYWRNQLGETHPVLSLPTDHPRLSIGNYRAAQHDFALPSPLMARLQQKLQAQGATLFMGLLTGFQALLYRYTGQSDIRVGVPIANRHRVETENLVGCLVNTQVLRSQLDGHMSLNKILEQTREAALGAQIHQDLPFEQLVQTLQPERSLHQHPLFQVMFNHLREDYRALEQLPGLTVEEIELGGRGAQFELTLDTLERADGSFSARFTYAAELFEAKTITRLGDHYLGLLEQLAERPTQCLGDVTFLSGVEQTQFKLWGVNERRYEQVEPVHHLIENQVMVRPDAIALIFNDTELSYAELNRRANRLAHRLIALGIKPESRVGIAVERSIDMIVGLLAILKSGGAYVPLDPDYPWERLHHMVADSAIELLLTQSSVKNSIPEPVSGNVLVLDRLDLTNLPEDNPIVTLHGEHAAYIIYTSGSTGQPKGAINRHSSLHNRLVWMQEVYPLNHEDTVLQKTPFSFDVSVWEFFWPLMYGARLAVANPGDHRDTARLVALIQQHKITTLHFVPSMLQAFMADNEVATCADLKRIICSGEALQLEMQEAVFKKLPSVKLYNLYGPTEAAIDVTYWTCRTEAFHSIPIGQPISNTKTYILDTSLNPVPQGVSGELYLGGAGLARGYLNRPGLTAERFVADPFEGQGSRLYRTGDLARWRPDGQIEYLGRVDHQVKVRGFRIELGEIEAQLLAQPDVREAVVGAREGPSGMRLIAYVSLQTGSVVTTSELREALAQTLPDYMLPSAIVVLDGLPLNANGKVDRKRLPEPEFVSEGEYAVPEGKVEEVLARIWSEVLSLGRVGRNDNFFELGGDSILSLQIVTRARQAGWKITPRQLFERQTIAALAVLAKPVEEGMKTGFTNEVGFDAAAPVPLFPIQLDFFEQSIPAQHHWNQAVLLKSRQRLQAEWLDQALQAIVQHHRALYFCYDKQANGRWLQRATGSVAQNLLWIRYAADSEQFMALCHEAQRSLHLHEGPLLRAVLIDMADNTQRLLLIAHHLVIDGVSWRILLEDLETAYDQAMRSETIVLPEATTDYAIWSQRLQHFPATYAAEFAYWQNLTDVPVALPRDYPEGSNAMLHIDRAAMKLDQANTQSLLKDAPAAYRTQVNDLLLTALGSALCQWSGHEKILIDLEGHGREDLYSDIDLSRTIGWFTSLFPVALDPKGDLGTRLKRIKECLRQVPHKGLGYGLFKYYGTEAQQRILASLPQAQVVFNYLGQFDTSFESDSLWQLASEPSGDTMDQNALQAHDLSINSHIYEGQLCLEVSYSKARYTRANMEAFIRIFLAELESVIAHCTQGIRAVTPSDFPLLQITQDELDHLPIPIDQLEDLYPLSPMQTGMLFHSVFDTEGGAYLNQLRADIGHLSVERFRSAWQAAIDRHEILRTGFLQEGTTPIQWVAKTAELPFVIIDWRDRTMSSAAVLQQALDDLAQSEHAQGFDLKKPPLIRIAVVSLADDRYHVIMTIHHLLVDGWSTSQLLGEVLRQYGGAFPSSPRARYRDFIAWLQRRERKAAEDYWQAWLSQFNEPTKLAGSIASPSANEGYQQATCPLDHEFTEALIHFSRQERVTVNTLVQAAWALLLGHYTSQRMVTFGVTVAGRPADLPGSDQMLGLFINTLPIKVELKPELAVGEWLRALQAQNLTSREHEHTPLYEIQRWAGQQELFDSILVFENYPLDEAFKHDTPGGLVITNAQGREETNYPMTVSVIESHGFTLQYSYDCKYFSEATVNGVALQVERLLNEIMQSAARRLGDLAFLSKAQQVQLKAWGINEQRFTSVEPVHCLFEQQALMRPEATALIFNDTELSYAELNRRANRLAHRLIALGIQPESRVGIAVERSIDMVVGLLAILKSGGAYVPLDPDYPGERLHHMMTDSAIELLLTQNSVKDSIPEPLSGNVLVLDTLELTDLPEDNPAVTLHGEHLAYIIYTSGSTGKPKGVAVAHGPLAMHVQAIGELYGMTPDDRELQFASINFDGAHERWLVPLAFGAALMPRDQEIWSADRTATEIAKHRITIACFTPSYLQQLAEFTGNAGRNLPIRSYTVGGEAMSRSSYDFVQATLQPPRIINGYGPTETVITPLIFKAYSATRFNSSYLPIGSPVGDRTAYILDAEMNQVPCGVTGELYLGGMGLARGYLNKPGLTAERFVADPFEEQGSRLYRTGDLARWRSDGQIEYLGRVDHQVKVRGFRIELGEIEAQLLAQPDVREAVVGAREGPSGMRLIAYVSLQTGSVVTTSELREALAQTLPDYMLPSAIVVLDGLPLNANGKVDRKRLPEPEFVSEGEYAVPEGKVEEVLARIWSEVLSLGRVGRNDNFFELGGDSILSLQIVTRARQAGWKITPRQLFERQTIAALAVLAKPVEEGMKTGFTNEVGFDAAAPVPLFPIQLDFFEQSIPAQHHWNQAVLLKSRQRLQAEWLDQALQAIVQHHRALYFCYDKQANGRWLQRATGSVAQNLLWIRYAADSEQFMALCHEAQRSLHLHEGPLLRAVLIDMADNTQRLLLIAHHLVIDGVSWRILLEDLETAYDQAMRSETIVLPEATTDYAIWSQRLQHFPATYAAEFAYWQNLTDVPVALPRDYPEGSNAMLHIDRAAMKLDQANTQSLLKDAPAAYRTQVNDLLLTALGSALCQWSGHEKILIDLEGHGREDLYSDIDLSRTIGWFTSLFPVALDPKGDLGTRLKRIKECLRQVPHKGLGYGLFKYYGTEAQQRILASLPQAQVVFNYLGQFDTSFESDSLWQLASEPSGDTMDQNALQAHDLSINSHIYEGQLCLEVSYSKARYTRANMEAFIRIFLAELESVIAHCTQGIRAVTPSDFPLLQITQDELDHLPIPIDQLEDLYPLSPMQTGMLFHSVFDTEGGAYLNQLRADIGHLSVERFRSAWQAAIDRHEILRTGFLQEGTTPIQWVAKTAELPFVIIDWRDRTMSSAAVLQQALDDLAQSEHAQGFDLKKPPLIRIAVVSLADDRYHVIMTIHHLLVDGWSTSQLLGEVLRQYGGAFPSSPRARYRDFIAWLQRRERKAAEDYWQAWLSQFNEPTKLAGSIASPSANEGYQQATCPLDHEFTEALIHFSRQERVTVNTLVQAAWALLLGHYTSQRMVTFGVTVAGRPADLPGSDQMLGLFINTLPIKVELKPELAVGEWLRALQAQNLTSREHEHTPLYEIQRWAGQQELFDSILVFENYPLDEAFKHDTPGGLVITNAQGREETNYPMTVSVIESHGFTLQYSYDCKYFSEATVNGVALQVERLLNEIMQSAARRLGDLALLSEAQQAQIMIWGVNEQRHISSEPVHRLIEQQAKERPEAIALIFGDTELSYAELNHRANRLAHHLIALGIQPESQVGIAVERSIDMVVGLLAILKAGGAYVPLDPDYPRERLNYMMTDSAIELLLTQRAIEAKIPRPASGRVLTLDTLDLTHSSEDNPTVTLHGEDLAYIIYTSGSTGQPKGVAVAHHALVEHALIAVEFFKLSSRDRMLQFSTINFDGFIEQLFPPLCVGATIVLRGSALWDSETFYHELIDKRITVADLTTAYWFLLVQDFAKEGPRDFGALRQVHAGGEAMSPEGIKAWRQTGLEGITLLNTYGPTEAIVTATIADCGGSTGGTQDYDQEPVVTIGKPLPARHIYLLDANLIPVLPGVAGELYIGGELLARGYLNRAGLTAERFVADPFGEQGGRIYRTGDLARWRPDGQIEYLGRVDHQVKIRGFRIELGEIETQLLHQPAVRAAVIVAKDGPNGTRLAAYVSLHAGSTLTTEALREALAQTLPDYMLPSVIVVLENLPLNANGKVDRKRLPEPELVSDRQYAAPEGEVEKTLAAIWAEGLGLRRVGRNDNFFELGGDSILSLQIVTQARRAGWKITPRQLFERQTIAALAPVVELLSESMDETPSLAPLFERAYLEDYLDESLLATLSFGNDEIEDIYPLSPTQEGMLFHTLEAPGTGLYVSQISVEVEGLDAPRLAQAWQTMIARHPVLRTGFLWRVGLARPLQIVFKQSEAPVIHLDWRDKDSLDERLIAYADQELKREFDFLHPPLARLSLIRLDDKRYQLIWTKHHILVDGWGDSILISDWLRCYNGEILPPAGPGYGVYVRWLAKQTSQATQRFWQTELSNIEGPTLLAESVAKAVKNQSRSGFAQVYTRLSPEETRRLQAFVQQAHVTLNTFVQAAWALLLQRYTGKQTVIFGATVAGRPPSLPQADEILGLFINMIPVPVARRSELSVNEYLQSLQQTNARLRDYEHSALADVQRWAGFPGQPLFDSIVVFENYPIDASLRSNELYGLRFGEIAGKGLTGYAMDLQVTVGESLEIEYAYGCHDFTDEFVIELRSHMEYLMREMMAYPQRMVGELRGIAKETLDRLLMLRSDTETMSSWSQSYQPVHYLIEHNAVHQPDAIALLMGEQEMTYAELNRRANQLAHRLIQLGAKPEIRFGVAMERSLDVIVTLLAILKSGAAYVPLDIDYPSDRLAFMMKDSALSVLITQSKVLTKFQFNTTVPVLVMDAIELEAEQVCNPEMPVHEHNLAYVIYTSGSTGLPKGVAVTHGPLAMHCQATARIYEMTPRSCELLFMSFSFDGAHERWLTALTVGAGLAVRDQELWTAEQTYDALRHYGITNAAFPPAYLGQVAEWANPRNDPPPVELYVFGGEAMPKASYDLIRRTLRPQMLINGYGPTETVVTPLIWKTDANNSFECAYAPIGRPVGKRVVYVLDVDMQPVPIGIVGELYIGGYGLARGYLGRAGLTAERFVADPFSEKGGRLYRTGDLVRWMEDGNIEYIGRADHQVKIRGFRIELGEIEARIREVTGIVEAAVAVHPGASGAQLVAYIVPAKQNATKQSSQHLIAQLRQSLGERLPEYMLPAHFITLTNLPRLPSGKLDRTALPEPDCLPGAHYQAPSTLEARLIANIWQEVLGVGRVGETDNFFALGGDSLSSLKVMARMRSLTDVKLDFKLRDLIQRPTIAGLLGLDKRSQPNQGLLMLNQAADDGRTQPLFCLHAGLGTVFDYQPLARRLQGLRTVYGLPCRMLANPAHRDTSLDQMAEDYCSMIRAAQPEGPYHLLGWSLGGTLAAMIAALLEAAGQTVAFLGLIDPYVPGTESPQQDDWQLDFLDFVSVAIPGVTPNAALQTTLASQSAGMVLKQVIVNLLESVLATRQAESQMNGQIAMQGYAEMGIEELANIFLVARHLKMLSLQINALRPLKCQTTCWWAKAREMNDRLALEQQIKPAGIRSVEIEADHFGMVRAEPLLLGMELSLTTTMADRDQKSDFINERI
ncbi:non-ribosomal peptide synthase/polyketide synthase [Nitrosomonas communis]|uniref:Non-ribosomal peptide synthase domain TIGR01720/amino acid adenylation domain-containing protein n=1 Tax=Nitrosomonas communis TaxID=44574 RepID=A0A1H2SZ48_9PROT|nr:non-ribosomal peptide synthetase [Nitrosomonas communis]SDW36840.1 non-ribosomal peptide synthase domain TIGR01720/amino acid adenylation domain-containing protein [Nitrosomonas communis]